MYLLRPLAAGAQMARRWQNGCPCSRWAIVGLLALAAACQPYQGGRDWRSDEALLIAAARQQPTLDTLRPRQLAQQLVQQARFPFDSLRVVADSLYLDYEAQPTVSDSLLRYVHQLATTARDTGVQLYTQLQLQRRSAARLGGQPLAPWLDNISRAARLLSNDFITYQSLALLLPRPVLGVARPDSAQAQLAQHLTRAYAAADNVHKQLELARTWLEADGLLSPQLHPALEQYLDSATVPLLERIQARANHAQSSPLLYDADCYNYFTIYYGYYQRLIHTQRIAKAAQVINDLYLHARTNDVLLRQIYDEGVYYTLTNDLRLMQNFKLASEVAQSYFSAVERFGSGQASGRKAATMAFYYSNYYARIGDLKTAERFYAQLIARAAQPSTEGAPLDTAYLSGLWEDLAEMFTDARLLSRADSCLNQMRRYCKVVQTPQGEQVQCVHYRRLAARLHYYQGQTGSALVDFKYLTQPKGEGISPVTQFYNWNRRQQVYSEYAGALKQLGRDTEARVYLDSAYQIQRLILERARALQEGFLQAYERAQQAELRAQAEQQATRERLQQRTLALVSSALVLLMLGFVVLAQNRRKILAQKRSLDAANKEIVSKSAEVENAYEEISAINDQLKTINDQLAVQNTNINDSINYAKRIQQALLPEANVLTSLFADHMVLDKPRDVVSGDFYWAHPHGQLRYWAVGDCTGHGVPGAFMSIIGMNLLEQAVVEWGLRRPDAILQRLHTEVVRLLKQQTGELRDGMDIGLVCIDPAAGQLQFAGAHHALFHIPRSGALQVHRADRHGIGGLAKTATVAFAQVTIPFAPGDRFYLTSDGFVDQFHSTGRRKFGQAQFELLLAEVQTLPLQAQVAVLNQRFEQWHGSHRQVDDVLVMGIEL